MPAFRKPFGPLNLCPGGTVEDVKQEIDQPEIRLRKTETRGKEKGRAREETNGKESGGVRGETSGKESGGARDERQGERRSERREVEQNRSQNYWQRGTTT
ncbi:hypothetical protein NDU88_004509 [Pleurodeles waltl]|uniref:Uncharacterized protein n=1 Tax=Pleurodeles waltl TaxID=8319 RepID=A0AAV7UH01_PLEWA|nr:hypothetical protein NDU88_004509 [Pleurodeles waltl]